MRKSQKLSQDLAYYDRLPEGNAEKSYEFLRRACQRQITLARLEGNRAAHARASQLGANTPALPSTHRQRQGKGEEGKGNNKNKKTRKGSWSRNPSRQSGYDSDSDSQKGRGRQKKERAKGKAKTR